MLRLKYEIFISDEESRDLIADLINVLIEPKFHIWDNYLDEIVPIASIVFTVGSVGYLAV